MVLVQIIQGRSAEEQRMVVLSALLNIVPRGLPEFFRERLFPGLMSVGFPLYSAMAWGARLAPSEPHLV